MTMTDLIAKTPSKWDNDLASWVYTLAQRYRVDESTIIRLAIVHLLECPNIKEMMEKEIATR